MIQLVRLTVILVLLWAMLSGLFKTQLIILGALSVLLVVWFVARMRVLEHQGQPLYFHILRIFGYWGWLVVQIVLSNIDVVKRIWARELDIKPTLRRVSATPDTEIGRVVYANSITLTPGTTAINFTPDDDILVHALHENGIDDLEEGEMADRIRQVEPHLRPTGNRL
ncbi:MAG: Na+/H+ antiporter subunit E [Granulosicoccus sp.]|nr:Na+/H+ antiporter subunit E [Granulosicoccus sp.]